MTDDDRTSAYLAGLPDEQRSALERLRGQLAALVPDAVPHFGYGLPGLAHRGRPLLYFGAAKAHCAIYGAVPEALLPRLKAFDVSKGTIRFTPQRPLPATLLKALVKAKVAALEEPARTAKALKGPRTGR
jgi:uncharacterized protein YdhG (YjbR/CyaY superfamily)